MNIEVSNKEDIRETFYDFYEHIAKRDMSNLLGKKVVKNEREVELAFERATDYIFEKKFNHTLHKFEGNEHADGCIEFDNGDLFLWDNKTKFEGAYSFPNDHLNQFKRYVRDISRNGKRVKCLLIIVPEYDDKAKLNAERLKYESGTDTDVAIIAAHDLKRLADEWSKSKNSQKINLHIFSYTGLLSKNELITRFSLFGN